MIGDIIRFLFSPAGFSSGPNGFQINGPFIVVVPLEIAFIFFFIASLIWVCRDARKRNKNAFVALIFILLTGWPASFIWWFWLRPPLKQ